MVCMNTMAGGGPNKQGVSVYERILTNGRSVQNKSFRVCCVSKALFSEFYLGAMPWYSLGWELSLYAELREANDCTNVPITSLLHDD